MTDKQTHSPEAPKVVRLVDYLAQIARLHPKQIRDIDKYEKVLWISDVPHEPECFTQAWHQKEEGEDRAGEWLEVQRQQEPRLSDVPVQCKEWVNQETLRNKNDLPELLPEITQ